MLPSARRTTRHSVSRRRRPRSLFVAGFGCCCFLLLDDTSITTPRTAGPVVLGGKKNRVPAVVRALSTTAASAARRREQSRRPLKKAVSVAIVGGGVAGLSCAERLTAGGAAAPDNHNKLFDVTVFDTGRLRPGGRCSSRQAGDPPKEEEEGANVDNNSVSTILSRYRYDHAAQILAVPAAPAVDDRDHDSGAGADTSSWQWPFAQQVAQWEREGIVQEFPKGSLYNIRSHRDMDVLNNNGDGGDDDDDDDDKSTTATTRYYYGTRGMGSIPQAMVQQNGGRFRLHQDVWVSPSNGVKYLPQSKQWRVQAAGRVWGAFDRLVIAHNGKCADRLTSRTPARELHRLLRVNFSSAVPARGGSRMTLNSLYSLTFAIRGSILSRHLPEAFVAGRVANHPALRFLTCQTRKYQTTDTDNTDTDGDGDIEVWTVLSSPTFAKKHKAPQEFLPRETVDAVTRLLLQAVHESVTGQKAIDPSTAALLPAQVLDARLQLWGAAVPLNVWCCSGENDDDDKESGGDNHNNNHKPAGFLYDADFGVGACGDWLLEPSLAGAWTSGRMLAQHMMVSNDGASSSSHGLRGGAFQKSAAAARAGIGAVPVAPSTTATTATATAATATINKKSRRTSTRKTPSRTRPNTSTKSKRRVVAKATTNTK